MVALSMLYEGARGDTAHELAQVLGFEVTRAGHNANAKNPGASSVANLINKMNNMNSQDLMLKMLNALYIDFQFEVSYKINNLVNAIITEKFSIHWKKCKKR